MSGDLLPWTLRHLERLVAFDTRNPPRAIDGGGIFAYLRDQLPPSFTVEVHDLSDGCVYLYATRGKPTLLINAHVDTVPADAGWTRDPHKLWVDAERATGLGACDIKGAVAALLAALPETNGDVALLFSSDEEAGQSLCVKTFLSTHKFADVIVTEPTSCQAVVEHRGIGTATIAFTGTAGHASAARAHTDSAVHEAVRWSARALDAAALSAAEAERAGGGGLAGLRLNLGLIEGGVKANMIASAASVRFGVRPPPGRPPLQVLHELAALAPDAARARLTPGFMAPPLPAQGDAAAARALATRLGLPEGPAVDFWTEAALFSQAGAAALVFGPGDIARAHAPDEWVLLSELSSAAEHFHRVLS